MDQVEILQQSSADGTIENTGKGFFYKLPMTSGIYTAELQQKMTAEPSIIGSVAKVRVFICGMENVITKTPME